MWHVWGRKERVGIETTLLTGRSGDQWQWGLLCVFQKTSRPALRATQLRTERSSSFVRKAAAA
jgi:hypothetical protein